MKYKAGIVRGIVKLFTFKILLWPIQVAFSRYLQGQATAVPLVTSGFLRQLSIAI